MAYRKLYLTATGCSGIRSIQTETSHSNISANCTIECSSTTLNLSDEVTVDGGYADDHGVLFKGYVKKIEKMIPDKIYKITVHDPLIRAVDTFLASDDPEAPLTFNNINDYDLVNAMLGQAGLPNVVSSPPSITFTFGTNPDGAKFNLQSVSDVLQFICSVTGRLIYADNNGDIYYVDRKPYVDTGDVPIKNLSVGSGREIIDISYSKSNDRTRNVIKVYGKSPLTAKAVGTSPYVVVDQIAVIAHELLDNSDLCQRTADVNLQLLNRLQSTWDCTLEGDRSIQARNIYSITEPFIGDSNQPVYTYRTAHAISEAGYTTSCTFTN